MIKFLYHLQLGNIKVGQQTQYKTKFIKIGFGITCHFKNFPAKVFFQSRMMLKKEEFLLQILKNEPRDIRFLLQEHYGLTHQE